MHFQLQNLEYFISEPHVDMDYYAHNIIYLYTIGDLYHFTAYACKLTTPYLSFYIQVGECCGT